jgi:hypothetical protein
MAQMSFSLGTILSTRRQVADEPLLAGDGPGIAGDLVLVVVHQDDAVGVGGDLLEVVVGGGDGGVDVEAQIARVQVGVELLDEAQVGRAGIVGQAFKVQRKAAIAG